jgi:hypothetical protein
MDYERYTSLPGAVYKKGPLPLLKIAAVKKKHVDIASNNAGSDYVWINLQPVNLQYKVILDGQYVAIWPRFLLYCKANWLNDEHSAFEQLCTTQIPQNERNAENWEIAERLDHAERFAVTLFQSRLVVREGDTQKCPSGGTSIIFNLNINSTSAQVDQIKRAVLENTPKINTILEILQAAMPEGSPKVVDILFQEESFFRGFYTNFIEGWVKSMGQ